jgi:Domain of unknown function (DUF4192)
MNTATEASTMSASAVRSDDAGAGGERVTVPVRSRAQLVNVVPYLLGFGPSMRDFVVLGATRPDGWVALTMRWDLPDPPSLVLTAFHAVDAVRALAAAGCTRAAAIGFGPDRLVAPQVTQLRQAVTSAGLQLQEALRAESGRYWCCLCRDPGCCPPEGTCSPAGDPAVVACEAAGAVALASRDVLAASIAPVGGEQAEAMAEAVRQARRRAARNAHCTARRRAAGRNCRPHATGGHRAVTAAVRVYRDGGSITSPGALATLAVALTFPAAGERAWLLMDPAYCQAHQRLWTDLARIAPPGLRAAPACLLALVARQSGNGALARIALDQAVADGLGHPMDTVLRDLIGSVAPPSASDLATVLRGLAGRRSLTLGESPGQPIHPPAKREVPVMPDLSPITVERTHLEKLKLAADVILAEGEAIEDALEAELTVFRDRVQHSLLALPEEVEQKP